MACIYPKHRTIFFKKLNTIVNVYKLFNENQKKRLHYCSLCPIIHTVAVKDCNDKITLEPKGSESMPKKILSTMIVC